MLLLIDVAGHIVEGRIEGEPVYVGYHLFDGRSGRGYFVAAVKECEHGLEHARGGSRGWYELACASAVGKITLPAVDGVGVFFMGKAEYAVPHCRGIHKLQERESRGETLQLRFGCRGSYAFGGEKL